MKKLMILLAACMLLVPAFAAAEEFEGNVAAPATALVTSPYGGIVQSVSVREGQHIEAGDVIARMQTVGVYAPEDGAVRGIFADPGDAVSSEAVLYIQPVNEYAISCTTAKAYASQDTKYVRVGEPVYIISVTDDAYLGEGVIIAVDETAYTVQTTAGDFQLDKNVYIYRDRAGTTEQRLGRGTIYRMSETPVYGSGSLLHVYVRNGETVKRGQLLFETVAGDMLYTAGSDGVIRAETSGTVESLTIAAGNSVQKDAVMMTIIPPFQYEIEFLIGEDLLSSVYIGQKANVVFNWSEDMGEIVQGVVSRISYISAEDSAAADSSVSEVQFKGYITFDADDTVKLGMSVTVETMD
ncbi:MAG: HlyD family efflux transporter periplasmic adaptor subunit [Bacillota bacterium]